MDIAVLASAPEEATQLCQALSNADYICHPFDCTATLLEQLSAQNWDMLVAVLSGVDMRVRDFKNALKPAAPILLVAGVSDEKALIRALRDGADDYLLKPVRRTELVMRTQVLLQRAFPDHPTLTALQFGPYSFEPHVARVTAHGKVLTLTRKEFELALLFFRHLGRPLSRAYILDVLWPGESEVPSRTLDTHVSRVRTKLELGAQTGYRLAPVYSYGYCLESTSAPGAEKNRHS